MHTLNSEDGGHKDEAKEDLQAVFEVHVRDKIKIMGKLIFKTSLNSIILISQEISRKSSNQFKNKKLVAKGEY